MIRGGAERIARFAFAVNGVFKAVQDLHLLRLLLLVAVAFVVVVASA